MGIQGANRVQLTAAIMPLSHAVTGVECFMVSAHAHHTGRATVGATSIAQMPATVVTTAPQGAMQHAPPAAAQKLWVLCTAPAWHLQGTFVGLMI